MQQIPSSVAQNEAYQVAVGKAQRRALDSYYDQHVITDDEAGYIAIDEGDYGALPMAIIDRIIYTEPCGLIDEY